MNPAQASDDPLSRGLLRAIADEESAKAVLATSDSRGVRVWEVPFALCIGIAIGLVAFVSGQPAVSAIGFGLGVAGLDLALVCARETRLVNKRLNALLELQRAGATRKGLESTIAKQKQSGQGVV